MEAISSPSPPGPRPSPATTTMAPTRPAPDWFDGRRWTESFSLMVSVHCAPTFSWPVCQLCQYASGNFC